MAAIDKVENIVKKAPKKGLTAREIAERAGVGYKTALFALGELEVTGEVEILGYVKNGQRGRPAKLYGKPA